MEKQPKVKTCKFYIRGGCFHSEYLNPGYETGFLCAYITEMMECWDDFLDRIEMFGISDDIAMNILSRRLSKKTFDRTQGCPTKCKRGTELFVSQGCPDLWGSLCISALPRCQGPCVHKK